MPGANPGAAAPDFAREWEEVREGRQLFAKGRKLAAEGMLRAGQALIRLRDAYEPEGRWLAALREHGGMSQPQASRYIRFAEQYAEQPECDREAWLRKVFSLSAAIGERRGKRGAAAEPRETGEEVEITVPPDELSAEVARRVELAIKMVDAGEAALGSLEPDYALPEVADEVRALIREGLEARLRKRLLPEGAP